MSAEREALKLALEFLEALGDNHWNDRKQAITAIKEALAQDELCSSQEPWMYRIWNDKDAQWLLTGDSSWPAEPLYTTSPKPEPRNFCSRCGKRTADLTVIHTCTPPRGLEMT